MKLKLLGIFGPLVMLAGSCAAGAVYYAPGPPPPARVEAFGAAPGPGFRLDQRILGLARRTLRMGGRTLGPSATSARGMGGAAMGTAWRAVPFL